MKRVAEFYKVSFVQFEKDYKNAFPKANLSHAQLKTIYDNIKLPKRATANSAGYDFFLPFDISLKAGEGITIPTGIRFECKKDYCLLMMPKSGLGNKNRFHPNCIVPLIDSDYFYSDNEGHILTMMIHDSRDSKAVLSLPAGKSYVQGVFLRFGITYSDSASEKRNGGFGSTDKNNQKS